MYYTALQRLEGVDLLEEFLLAMPLPILDVIKHLVGTLDPDKTQTRLFEVGPKKWWLENLQRLPKVYEVMHGGARGSYYQIGTVTCRVTNMPIYSPALDKQGLKFVELDYQLYIITEHDLMKRDSYIHCRHFAQDSWLDSSQNLSGVLVCDIFAISIV